MPQRSPGRHRIPGVLVQLKMCPRRNQQDQNLRNTLAQLQEVPMEEPAGSESQEYTYSITRCVQGGTSRIGIQGVHLFNYKRCLRRYQQDRNPRNTLVQLQEVPISVPAGTESQEYSFKSKICPKRFWQDWNPRSIQLEDVPKEVMAGSQSQKRKTCSTTRCAQGGTDRDQNPGV